MTDLPQPGKTRWQPLRAGLVELFYYDYEEFHFHDGRLLLRGNNGTGKSKVMALTLPFLLDGRLSPARVEPDGDSSKRMEWNLLMGEPGERQGYAWLEFGRLGDQGPEFLTLGCGLKAVAQRGVRSWFFITPQRIGESLFLVEDGRTLSRDRLNDALGPQGRPYDQATAYRKAVDEQLFHLGPERYEALLDLLLQLRQPQLSKRPDESRLSNALTEALRPLDSAVIADVAEAYRNLEAEADETRGLEEAHHAVSEFLGHYRRYAGIAARRRAGEVRRTHREYEDTRARIGHQRKNLDETRVRDAALAEREMLNEHAVQEADQQRQTLRDSPAMRSAAALHAAENTARERRDHARSLSDLQARTEQDRSRLDEQAREQQAVTAEAADAVAGTLQGLATAAEAAGIAEAHHSALARFGLPEPGDVPLDQIERQLQNLHDRRRESVRLLQQHNRELADAERRVETAREHWQHQVDEHDRLTLLHQDAREAAEAAADRLLDAWRGCLTGLHELLLDDTEEALADLSAWLRGLEGPNPAQQQLELRRDLRIREIAADRSRHQHERDGMQQALDALEHERLRLETGAEIAPPVPHVRDDALRATRAGAPFWKLVDFHAGVSAEARAGVEAALESAGLLDAWILPGGQLLDPYTWDTLLTADLPVPAQALDALLRPAVDWQNPAQRPVGATEVAAILARIGLGKHPEQAHWVAEDGRWRLGPARGAWGKGEAQYIGHAARAAARQARLRQIASEVQACRDAIAAATEALQLLELRETRIREEWQGRPEDGPLRTAYAEEASALRALESQTERTDAARKALEARSHEAGEQRQRRDELAADLSLPSAEDPLAAVARAVETYGAGTRELCRGLRDQRRERIRLERMLQDLELARSAARRAMDDAANAESNARNAETQRDTLRETIGADVEELERRLAEVERRQAALKAERQSLGQERTRVAREIGGLEADIANGEQQLVEIGERRAAAITRLREFAESGLVPMATADRVTVEAGVSWAPEPAVLLSRRMEQALAEVDESDAAWQRHQKGLHQHFAVLQAALGRHGHDAHIEQHDDLLLVRIIFQGRHHGPDALAAQLAREIERRRELLTARERELVENYLLDEVASHLQARMMETEAQVRQINEELAQRPTSTGMRLRIQWQALAEGQQARGLTAPAGLEVTRNRLLRQSMDAWSADDRRAVGEFIQGRIREARETDSAGALTDVLERALDYRHWHRFTVERWQNSRWRPAYGPASGGERALVITLPLFAAAASHYESAQPAAPRLIMLDEVFAGVDDDARAKSMGLLAQFDLDTMMTSEREWGCYPEVPGLAIAQLIRRDGIDAVYVSRWRWDGAHRIRESAPQTPMEAAAGTSKAAEGSATEELF
jgi:uncharacterized protein (TIGR02680 family)